MFIRQGGRCAICGTSVFHWQAFSVDHNHDTGKVRALLCQNCNAALGKFNDDKHLIQKPQDTLSLLKTDFKMFLQALWSQLDYPHLPVLNMPLLTIYSMVQNDYRYKLLGSWKVLDYRGFCSLDIVQRS